MSTFAVIFFVVITFILVADARLIDNKENEINLNGFHTKNLAPSGDVQKNEVFGSKSRKVKITKDFDRRIDHNFGKKHQKATNWQQGFKLPDYHPHSDGAVYYFQGFKCEPIDKLKQHPRPGMKRDCLSSSSTIFCLSSFVGG